MCGIAGILGPYPGLEIRNVVLKMANKLVHRGPDSSGVWTSNHDPIALAHRRLSIVDLSETGHQPMISSTGRYVISFNGEIYNHRDLRDNINVKWMGTSDTETLLAAIEKWGIHKALEKVMGMFAFSLWDKHNKTITLARDRFGEKPLFYSLQKNSLIFASELKSLKVCDKFNFEIDIDSVRDYLTYGYVSSPNSIYKNVFKVKSGSFVVFGITSNSADSIIQIKEYPMTHYWSQPNSVEKESNIINLFSTELEAKSELKRTLCASVKRQMISDVPFGAYLSGGIDSSLIVSIMQENSSQPINTFTVGFDKKNYDESIYASNIAKYLGTNHHELIMTSNDIINFIPNISNLLDEPFSDASIIPTFLVSKYARKYVKVALSGDGGDEFFCGYNRYLYANQYFKLTQTLPLPLRSFLRKLILNIPPQILNTMNYCSLKLTNKNLFNNINLIYKGAVFLDARSGIDLYLKAISYSDSVENLLLNHSNKKSIDHKYTKYFQEPNQNLCEQMMSADTDFYLENDILVKLDRAAMAASLETRVPFIDIDVFNTSLRMPFDMKMRGKSNKWILKMLLSEYIPRNFFERPKSGFDVPIGDWLKGPLREWSESILDEKKINSDGIFDFKEINIRWKKHLSGAANFEKQIWNILMFQLWINNI